MVLKKIAGRLGLRRGSGYDHVRDRLVSSQPHFRLFYKGDDLDYFHALNELIIVTTGQKAPEEDFDLIRSPQVPIEALASPRVQASFLQSLVLMTQARNILEIGTFIGISSLYMARASAPEAIITTLEKYDHFAGIARENFKRNRLDHKIRLIEGSATETLGNLKPSTLFDLAFLDGGKESYLDYFKLIDPLLRPGGLIIVDDIMFQGDVFNTPPKTYKTKGVQDLLVYIKNRQDYHRVLLPLCDGILLLCKRN